MAIPVWTEKTAPADEEVVVIMGGIVVPVASSAWTECEQSMSVYTECSAPAPVYTEVAKAAPVWTEKAV